MDRESPGDNKLSRFQDIKADVFPYRKLKLDCVRRIHAQTHTQGISHLKLSNLYGAMLRILQTKRTERRPPFLSGAGLLASASFNISCAVTMCLYCFNNLQSGLPWLCLWVYCPCTVSHPRPFQTRMTVLSVETEKTKVNAAVFIQWKQKDTGAA